MEICRVVLLVVLGLYICSIDVYANDEILQPIPNSGELQVEMKEIYFEYDSELLSPKARKSLDKYIEIMKNDPSITVSIEGHCDENGSDVYNLKLGEKRAMAAMSYIVKMGIS